VRNDRVLLDDVSWAGVRSTLFTDPDWRCPIIRTQQDCAPIVEANKQQQRDYNPRAQHNAMGLRKVASIPPVVWQQLAAIGIVSGSPLDGKGGLQVLDEKAFLALLSDPDFRWLRTDNGARLI
jgi:hypothetical protein